VRQAKAFPDVYHLDCVPSSSCTTGSVSFISTGSSVTFNIINTGGTALSGTAFLAVLVPTGGSAPVVTGATLEESVTFSSGSVFTALNEACSNCTDFNLTTMQSASAQVNVNPTSYTIYEYNAGAFNSSGNGAAGNTAPFSVTAPQGSVIVSFLEDSNGNVFEQTPLSHSITIGTLSAVPEPGSMALFGTGLLILGGAVRRRMRKQT
jgi:hypothetical protein